MIREVFLFSVFCILATRTSPLDKHSTSSSEEENPIDTLASLKEFVNFVNNHNLNVSVIGSQTKYGSNGIVKESLSMTLHMPRNDVYLTQSTLDDAKQDKYLKKLDLIGNKEHIGAKARVIKIDHGEDEVVASHSVHPSRIITSPGYESLTNYQNGVTGFKVPTNVTTETVYNYHIKHPSDNIENVQVVAANVIINPKDISSNFPSKVLDEINTVLPSFYLSLSDKTVLSRILVNYLDNKFPENYQVFVGIDTFALGGKEYANIEVADTNVVVFIQ